MKTVRNEKGLLLIEAEELKKIKESAYKEGYQKAKEEAKKRASEEKKTESVKKAKAVLRNGEEIKEFRSTVKEEKKEKKEKE